MILIGETDLEKSVWYGFLERMIVSECVATRPCPMSNVGSGFFLLIYLLVIFQKKKRYCVENFESIIKVNIKKKKK